MSELELNLFRLQRVVWVLLESRDAYSGNLILHPEHLLQIADRLEASAKAVADALRKAGEVSE